MRCPPPWFLKEYAHEIGPILTAIYQASIDSRIVPSWWKYAPRRVFKSGEKSDPCNYRPISLTCIASKVLEHIVHSHVIKHLDSHRIFTDVQHGFRAKRSTVTQLITTIHDLAKTHRRTGTIRLGGAAPSLPEKITQCPIA